MRAGARHSLSRAGDWPPAHPCPAPELPASGCSPHKKPSVFCLPNPESGSISSPLRRREHLAGGRPAEASRQATFVPGSLVPSSLGKGPEAAVSGPGVAAGQARAQHALGQLPVAPAARPARTLVLSRQPWRARRRGGRRRRVYLGAGLGGSWRRRCLGLSRPRSPAHLGRRRLHAAAARVLPVPGGSGFGCRPRAGAGGTPVSVSPGALAPEQGGYVGPPSLSLGFLAPACRPALSPEQGVSGTPMSLSLGALSPVRPSCSGTWHPCVCVPPLGALPPLTPSVGTQDPRVTLRAHPQAAGPPARGGQGAISRWGQQDLLPAASGLLHRERGESGCRVPGRAGGDPAHRDGPLSPAPRACSLLGG